MPARSALVLTVLIGLTLLHTWPIPRAPGRESLNHNADAQFCAFTLSWIARTVVASPLELFDTPIFWPEPNTLAYSDPMLPAALIGAPVRWLGGSPVLTFNLVMLTGLALTAFSAAFVAWRWTGSMTGAIVAGALAAFNVHLLTRLPHIVAAHSWGLPMTMYLADRLSREPSRRGVLLLSLTIAAIAMTSPYLLALAAVIIGATVAVRLMAGPAKGSLAATAAITAATLAGLAAAIPVLVPYVELAATGARRPIEIVEQFSATPHGYLASSSRLHRTWSAPFTTNDVNMFFPGAAALILAAVGVLIRSRDRKRAWTIAAIGAIGMLLSFGPATPIYRSLYEWLLPLQGLRAAARFGYLFLLAVALLAGIGASGIASRLRSPAARAVFLSGALAIITVESWQGPVRTQAFRGVPAVYSLLAQSTGPIVLVETPFFLPEAAFEHGEYVLNATAHWQPLMNGYSGLLPASFRRRAGPFWRFPRPEAIQAMKQEGATHVMVHLERFGAEATDVEQALLGRRDLQLLGSDTAGHRLYRLVGQLP
jgi:hypothetical protein